MGQIRCNTPLELVDSQGMLKVWRERLCRSQRIPRPANLLEQSQDLRLQGFGCVHSGDFYNKRSEHDLWTIPGVDQYDM